MVSVPIKFGFAITVNDAVHAAGSWTILKPQESKYGTPFNISIRFHCAFPCEHIVSNVAISSPNVRKQRHALSIRANRVFYVTF